MRRCTLTIFLMLCVGFAVQAQTDSTRLMIDSLTRELKEMKLKEMLMQEALEHSGETARMDSLRQAEQKQRIDSLRQTTPGVPLIIDGDTLLVVYASLGGESPVSRVESLQYKILQLGKSLKMTTDTMHIFESEYTADIMSGELVMMRVSDLDGLWHGMTRRQLAEENMRIISQAIEALQCQRGFQRKTAPAFPMHNGISFPSGSCSRICCERQAVPLHRPHSCPAGNPHSLPGAHPFPRYPYSAQCGLLSV